jgi:hypothetical protein
MLPNAFLLRGNSCHIGFFNNSATVIAGDARLQKNRRCSLIWESNITELPYLMLHVKDFKINRATTPATAPPSTEIGRGTIDYHPIFAAAKKASIKHAFVEQEQFDMPMMDALKIDADYMRAFA